MTDAPVTVVTGTRTGIGRFLVERLCGAGSVVIGCSRSPATFEHPSYQHFQADVSQEQDVRAMFAAIRQRHGRLDNLVNNAGAAAMNHALLTPPSQFRALIEVNAVGTLLCSQEAAKLMQRRRYGRIVNFASVALPLALEGEAAYVAAKAAVVGLTRVLARELSSFGITVNAVGPGPVDTDLVRGVPSERLAELRSRLRPARDSSMEDVANVVEFFLRPESSMVTGQALYLGVQP